MATLKQNIMAAGAHGGGPLLTCQQMGNTVKDEKKQVSRLTKSHLDDHRPRLLKFPELPKTEPPTGGQAFQSMIL